MSISLVRGGMGPCRRVGVGGGTLAGAPGTVRVLVTPPGAAGVVPRRHHHRVLRTPPGFQAGRDQPGSHAVFHKCGPAAFRDHIQAHLVGGQTLLITRVIDQEAQLLMDPAPIRLTVAVKMRHGLSPFPGVFLWCFSMEKGSALSWLSLPDMWLRGHIEVSLGFLPVM